MDTTPRLATREAARLLDCRASEALLLLRAAGVPSERIGSAYLWDRAAVEALIGALRVRRPATEREHHR